MTKYDENMLRSREEGMQEGIQEGHKEGREEMLEECLTAMTKEFGISKDKILAVLKKNGTLSQMNLQG